MKIPNFNYERRIWKHGYRCVGGLDEAGRGALAGPVVCGCVVFSHQSQYSTFRVPDLIRIDDSKKLTNLQRQKADKWIKDNCLAWGIGVGSVAEINRLGISKATASGFRRSVTNTNTNFHTRVEYLLIDAFYVPYVRGLLRPRKSLRKRSKQGKYLKITKTQGNQLAIVHGDEKIFSIAAASIIAKVYRDKMMIGLSEKPASPSQYRSSYKKYGWEDNKGYGTQKHIRAIRKYGATKWHRKLFIRNTLKKQN
jgi:ribonuclease HII